MNILVSGCLIGINCRYDCGSNLDPLLLRLMEKHNLIPVCPEQLGGLTTPREPAEIIEDRVMNKSGVDVTKAFELGAEETLKIAALYNCKYAILKERSPSCGHGQIYDGSFSGNIIDGDGITSKLLMENGIKIYGESHLSDLNDIFS